MDIGAVLHTWHTLLPVISKATEEECEVLLEAEKKGQRRLRMLMRIHSRLNRVRAQREREYLTACAVTR